MKKSIPQEPDGLEAYFCRIDESRRKRIAAMAKEGAALASYGAMCKTCAFKLDSPANLEPDNVSAAIDALYMPGFVFNCHLGPGVNKGCECTGFRYAKIYLESLDPEDR